MTFQEIEQAGFQIDEKVEMIMSSDSSIGVCKSMGLGMIGYAEALDRLAPDILVVLGDRYEAFAAAAAAMLSRIPIAHIHGGEITTGAMDESIRHAITKMSHLHFTSTEEYRRRVIQLGEDPERVFNVGALGIENIRNCPLPGKKRLEKEIKFHLGVHSALVTFHPVTLEKETAADQFGQLLHALNNFTDLKIIFTKANADMEGRIINRMIDDYVDAHADRAVAFTSMGQIRYLSAMKYVSVVVGNSSSGIIEAPSFGVPTVNIGDRQKGRVRAESVIDCPPETKAITDALRESLSPEFKKKASEAVNPYDKKNTARAITTILANSNQIHLKKDFYDLHNR